MILHIGLLHEFFMPACFIPKGEFYATPNTEFVINSAEIVFDHGFGRAQRQRDLAIL